MTIDPMKLENNDPISQNCPICRFYLGQKAWNVDQGTSEHGQTAERAEPSGRRPFEKVY